MILDENTKYALSMVLNDYIQYPKEYFVPSKIITTSYSDEEKTLGFSTDDAKILLNSLENGNLDVDDKQLNYIIRITYTFKESINDFLIMKKIDNTVAETAKADRRAVNALIRLVKSYCKDNGIFLDSYEDNE